MSEDEADEVLYFRSTWSKLRDNVDFHLVKSEVRHELCIPWFAVLSVALSLTLTATSTSRTVAQQRNYAYKTLGLYPVNTLRNIALIRSRTEHVLTLDVDFVPSPDSHDIIMCVRSSACGRVFASCAVYERGGTQL
jgi:hypothetical protein